MRASLQTKLQHLLERHEELAILLSDPSIISDQGKFRQLSKDYAQLGPIVENYQAYQCCLADIAGAQEMMQEPDAEMKALAQEEFSNAQKKISALEQSLQILLLPQDPNDGRNIFLEVRAGTGGDEAAIFSGDLARMYIRYAERQAWKIETMSANEGEHGGYKEIILRIKGDNVYSKLKFESGGHRVQRVPETESQGRIHTSACTVAILAEVEIIDNVDISPSDLRIDTFRSSGAGGQHVNTTDSAIRITHLPTGVVVECQDERSQHKNKARALSLLQARILAAKQAEQQAEISENRRSLVGTGDRSGRIRTYNYPQGRVTDHRINLTLYKLDDIMGGNLGEVIEPLIREHQADLLACLNEG